MTQVSEDLVPVLGTEVEKQQALAQAAIASECKVVALLQSLEQAELTAQLARIDAFFAAGLVQGEDIAVYLCEREGKAGIAVLMYNGPWIPTVVDFSKISPRFDD